MAGPSNDALRCWICGSCRSRLHQKGTLDGKLTPNHFLITNSDYGKTADIYRCADCGFLQASLMKDIIAYYQDMVDEEYEKTRQERLIQERSNLQVLHKYKSSGRLLDVGAGNGILVEEAQKLGYACVGIEPSRWLCQQAVQRGLPVLQGSLPGANLQGLFDVVTMVDVIEHVSDPVGLLKEVRSLMASDGVGMVVTPDIESLAARVLGRRWWHRRVAHIGYFSKRTLSLALQKAGLRPLHLRRPRWYFNGDYLYKRMSRYVPLLANHRLPETMAQRVVALNLLDSWLVIFGREEE